MKANHRILIWGILLMAMFATILGTFCYFLGKTDSLGDAMSEFIHFGYILFPLFLVVIGLAVSDIRRIGKKKKE